MQKRFRLRGLPKEYWIITFKSALEQVPYPHLLKAAVPLIFAISKEYLAAKELRVAPKANS